jgi:4-amino-4-deoxy-L-arabinose transferase-like glycosyltransferase
LLLPAALVVGWTQREEPGVRFAVCWLVPTWLMFELLPTKLVHYELPAYGALAMLMAAAVRGPIGTRARWIGGVLSILMGALLAAVAIYGQVSFGTKGDMIWTAFAALLALGAGAAGAVLLLRRQSARALVTAGALGVAAHIALTAGLIPRLEPLFLSRDLATTLEAARLAPRSGAPGPVAVTGYAEPSLIFQLGTTTQLTDGAGAAQAIVEGRPAIVEAREEKPFQDALKKHGLTARPAAVVEGLNYSDGDQERLTVYRGELIQQQEARP